MISEKSSLVPKRISHGIGIKLNVFLIHMTFETREAILIIPFRAAHGIICDNNFTGAILAEQRPTTFHKLGGEKQLVLTEWMDSTKLQKLKSGEEAFAFISYSYSILNYYMRLHFATASWFLLKGFSAFHAVKFTNVNNLIGKIKSRAEQSRDNIIPVLWTPCDWSCASSYTERLPWVKLLINTMWYAI